MPTGLSSRNGTKKTRNKKPTRIERGSGNVFADLGLPNPELALMKAKLVQNIRASIKERKLTPSKSSELLGIDKDKIAALVRGRVEGYSVDRLFKFLHALGQQIEITVRPAVSSTLP